MENRSLPPKVLVRRGELPYLQSSPRLSAAKQLVSDAATPKSSADVQESRRSAARVLENETTPRISTAHPLERRMPPSDAVTISFPDRRKLKALGSNQRPGSAQELMQLSDHEVIGDHSQEASFARTDYGRLQTLMEDPDVEEIWLNSPNRIFYAKSGVSQLSNVVMTADEVRGLIERLLMWGGRRLDLSNPFVDARLPDGSRLHVAIPEITAKHWAINIRKHIVRGNSLAELVSIGVLSTEVQEFLTECVVAGKNILVSGSTQAGKTTLLNALIGAAPNKSRVITIEEVFELRPKVSDCVAMQTRSPNLQGEGEIPLRRLIKEALRMRPSRLVVGEIREAESLDLLIALNSGLPGAATIHANSAQDAIAKLQTLPLLAGENIPHRFITPVVASAIDLVVHISLNMVGRRTVTQVLALTGRVEGDHIETEPVFTLYANNTSDKPEYIRGIGQVEGVGTSSSRHNAIDSLRAKA